MNYKVSIFAMSMVLGLSYFASKGMKGEEELLFQGASTGSLILIERAIAKGAQLETKDAFGRTSLHIAACSGHHDCLRALLEKGAQIDAKDNAGITSLYTAAFFGHPGCLRVLLEQGAEIKAQDTAGRTALHRVADKDTDFNIPFGGHLACLGALLGKEAQIETKDDNDMAALRRAAAFCQLECLRILLEKGAQIETKDKRGLTALHSAATLGRQEVLRALLLAGAHIIESGASSRVIAPLENKVRVSRRRLKVALLALRYAGSDSDIPKSAHAAGDLITSNSYLRSWIFLSHPDIKEDVFTILMSLLAEGKKVDDPLFKQAQEELGDYLIMRLRDTLNNINTPNPIESVLADLSEEEEDEIRSLCDPDLVEQNFGDVIRSSIRKRYRELYLGGGVQETTPSSSPDHRL